jgi:hypothetical protein
MVLDIQIVHHILKNTAVQNVNKPFVYITDLTSTLRGAAEWHLPNFFAFCPTYQKLKISWTLLKITDKTVDIYSA